MSDEFKKNEYGLTDEYADILASVFGDDDNAVVTSEVENNNTSLVDEDLNNFHLKSNADVFDSRFTLGQRDNTHYKYDGYIVNDGADVDYTQSEQPRYDEITSSYAKSYEDIIDDEDFLEEIRPSASKKQRKKSRNRKRDYIENFEDESDSYNNNSIINDSSADYYYDEDYEYENNHHVSFAEFVVSRFTGIFFKVKGAVPADATSSTMEEDDEQVWHEVTPLYGSKYYGSLIYSLRIRTNLALFMLSICIYLSLGLPVPGMLQSLQVVTMAVMAIQFTIMVISLDVVTNAITNIAYGKLGIDTLAIISCIVTSIDGFLVNYSGISSPHMPLCAVSSASLVGILFSSLLSTRGIRKALRVPAIGKTPYTVTGEQNIIGHDITLLKSTRPINGIVRRIEEEPLDEEKYRKFSPFIILSSLLVTAYLCYTNKSSENALYIFSLIFCSSIPVTALLCFALPFYVGSARIFGYGAAIAGWSGTCDIGHSKNLIVTDRDLFPPENIEIENVRIFADYSSSKVISYAGSLILNSKCGLVNAFEKLMAENNCSQVDIDGFECLTGGGTKGYIEGHIVLCGSSDLMRLMDIKIPYRLVTSTSVLLAVDGVLYGIFNLKYTPDAKVRKALVSLMKSNRHPVFAVRDFNITPDMIHDYYDVATDGYDFPPYTERFPLSEAKPAHDSKIAAVICREGLGPLTAMADTGRSIYVVTKLNTTISILSSFLGIALSYFQIKTYGTLGIGLILLYLFASSIPIIINGIITKAVK